MPSRALTIAALAASCLAGCEQAEVLGVLREPPERVRPLAPPTLVEALSDPDFRDTDPTFTADLREVYFMSDRLDSKDLFVSRRHSPAVPWPAPERVAELSTPAFQEENPHVSRDGLTLWFYTDRDRSQGTIWQAKRRTREDPWGDPTAVTELGGGERSSDVALGVDDTQLFAVLASRSPVASSYDLYMYTRQRADEPFSSPTPLSEVSAAGADDYDGVLMGTASSLAFHSNRAGSEDIFVAYRASSSVPFGAPVAVAELNTAAAESAPAFSSDLEYVMFSSDRDGSHDIFETNRAPDSP